MHLLLNILKNFFRRPPTRLYPFEKRTPFVGARGHIDMDPDVCIYCSICERRCPSHCITVTKNPNTWSINRYQCIVCNYCVEVCPVKCIRMNAEPAPKIDA